MEVQTRLSGVNLADDGRAGIVCSQGVFSREAAYVEQLQKVRSAPTAKLHLAALRHLFDRVGGHNRTAKLQHLDGRNRPRTKGPRMDRSAMGPRGHPLRWRRSIPARKVERSGLWVRGCGARSEDSHCKEPAVSCSAVGSYSARISRSVSLN
jgi:hypothetical protein